MRRGTQACLSRLALTHFKQTQAEIVARHRIVRPQSERTPKEIGGSGVVAVQSHHLGQWSQNIGPLRRRRKRLHQHRASIGTVVAFEMKETELNSQFDGVGRKR